MKIILNVLAAAWEFLDWCGLLLRTCARGRHSWEGFTDGKRTLYICARCMKQTKDYPE